MQLPYSENIEIQYLSRIFDNTSECYKFFGFRPFFLKCWKLSAIYSTSRRNVP